MLKRTLAGFATITAVLLGITAQGALASTLQPDPNFGTNGVSKPVLGERVAGALPSSSGSTLLAVQSYADGGRGRVVRIDSSGTLDRNFGEKGVAAPNAFRGAEILGIAEQPNGKIVLAGGKGDLSFSSMPVLVRLNADGSLDRTFTASFKRTRGGPFFRSVAIQKDGAIIVAGGMNEDTSSGTPAGIVQRFRSSGRLDRTFGTKGRVLLKNRRNSESTSFQNLLIASTGHIVAGGYLGSEPVVVRLKFNGKFDPKFSRNGIATEPIGTDHGCGIETLCAETDLLTAPRGAIFQLATRSKKRTPLVTVIKFSQRGHLVRNFGTGGITTVRSQGRQLEVGGLISRDRHGRILVYASSATGPVLLRILPNGKMDSNFGRNGTIAVSGVLVPDTAAAARGGVLVAGGNIFSKRIELAQFRAVPGD